MNYTSINSLRSIPYIQTVNIEYEIDMQINCGKVLKVYKCWLKWLTIPNEKG